ncbi:MAG: GNAT family N-acetyltransferase [Burkholderiaceae bacterium]|jgi:GNAT superfamily N-acetyltransferase
MAEPPSYVLRPAVAGDVVGLEQLIRSSARVLGAADYRSEQIEAALEGTFGVDSRLIEDGTLWLAERGPRLLGCGGWSFRGTLFGGDRVAGRDSKRLDPRHDAARIRAFFVDPEFARRGIGRSLLWRCESEARAAGFRRMELMATRTGQGLYASEGYRASPPLEHALNPVCTIEFIPMAKDLAPTEDLGAVTASAPTAPG